PLAPSDRTMIRHLRLPPGLSRANTWPSSTPTRASIGGPRRTRDEVLPCIVAHDCAELSCPGCAATVRLRLTRSASYSAAAALSVPSPHCSAAARSRSFCGCLLRSNRRPSSRQLPETGRSTRDSAHYPCE